MPRVLAAFVSRLKRAALPAAVKRDGNLVPTELSDRSLDELLWWPGDVVVVVDLLLTAL